MLSVCSKEKQPRRRRPFTEAGVWESFGFGWQPLWAGFHQHGFSVEWHDFECRSSLDWAGSFHPNSIEICLNLEGAAEFSVGNRKQALPPASATFYVPG